MFDILVKNENIFMSLTASVDSLQEFRDSYLIKLCEDDPEEMDDLKTTYNNLVVKFFWLTKSNLKVSNKLKKIELENDNLLQN